MSKYLILFLRSMFKILIYYVTTEIYSQNDSDEKIVLILVTANQRTVNFH